VGGQLQYYERALPNWYHYTNAHYAQEEDEGQPKNDSSIEQSSRGAFEIG
jgi:hypothetical protein